MHYASSHHFRDINIKKYVDLENYVMVMELTTCNIAFRLQISMSIKVAIAFLLLALTVSKILMFQMFELENLG